jgi:hypothetical protein
VIACAGETETRLSAAAMARTWAILFIGLYLPRDVLEKTECLLFRKDSYPLKREDGKLACLPPSVVFQEQLFIQGLWITIPDLCFRRFKAIVDLAG